MDCALQEVIVALDDLDEAGFRRVLREVRRAGLRVLSSSAELGFLTGEAAPGDFGRICAIPGVASVEPSRTVGVFGPA